MVLYRRNWGENRVYFHADEGHLVSLAANWTDVDPLDPFVAVAAGRSHFRVRDLLELADLIEKLTG